MKKKLLIMTAIILSVAMLTAGCAAIGDETSPTPTPTQSASPEPTPEDTSYTVVDSQGNEITFKNIPNTLVSLAPNITEIVFALGCEDKLLARTDWCNYPEEVSDYVSVGNIDQPDVEKIIELQPDVVILTEITKQELAYQIRDAGIPIFVVDNEESFSGAYTSIEMVGAVLGAEEKAAEIVTSMKTEIDEIIATVADAEKKTVYYVMGYGEFGDFTAGKGTFISEMIAAAGGINVADDTDGWSYSVEKLVEHDPDLLLLSMYSPAEGLKEATGYKDLTAVKEGRMFTTNDDTMHRLGPRLSEAFRDIAKAIHPELFE